MNPSIGDRPTRRQALRAALATAAASAAAGCGARRDPAVAQPAATRPGAAGRLPPGPAEPLPTGRRPNIIYLMTDDQRADSLGCAGNPVLRTPHVDALAADGVRFTNVFATTAICFSSRITMLTGQYTRVHGIEDFETPLAPAVLANTYPMLLRRAGYRTGFVGKWGIGGPLPVEQYDYWAGYPKQGFYFEPGQPKHLTARQGDQAIEFLRGCKREQPFCLAVSFKAPHVQDEGFGQPGLYPHYPYDHAYDRDYTGGRVPPVKTRDERPMPAFFGTSFNVQREGPDFKPANYQDAVADLYRLLAGVDDAVGRIVAAVGELGFADDTVIVYTSDHGSFYGEHGWGGKWLMHEESIRSPLVVFDPRLPHRLRGTTREQVVCNVDAAPTLLDLAGLPTPESMQGRSWLPLLWGQTPPWRTEFFYEHHFGDSSPNRPIPASEGVRTPEWKYIRYVTVRPLCEQLYHLPSDPREERDLSDRPECRPALEAIRRRWEVWGAALTATRRGAAWVEPAPV